MAVVESLLKKLFLNPYCAYSSRKKLENRNLDSWKFQLPHPIPTVIGSPAPPFPWPPFENPYGLVAFVYVSS